MPGEKKTGREKKRKREEERERQNLEYESKCGRYGVPGGSVPSAGGATDRTEPPN